MPFSKRFDVLVYRALFAAPLLERPRKYSNSKLVSLREEVRQLVAQLTSLEICAMANIVILVLITLIPTLELRASIPFGILKADMPWWGVVVVCVTTNIILGPLVYLFLDKVMVLLLRFGWLNRAYQRTVVRTQRRIQNSVDRYGELGVALFIGIPLPGTGSYSGALGAYLIGLGYRKFIIANVIGVLIAGTIVTAVALSGVEVFRFLIKVI